MRDRSLSAPALLLGLCAACSSPAQVPFDLASLLPPDGGADAPAPPPDLPPPPPDTGDAGADGPALDAPLPEVVFGACDTAAWSGVYPLPGAEVECATVLVPVDHLAPDGPTLPLTVARQRSRQHPTGRVMFTIAGGPGGSAVELSGTIPQVLPGLLEEVDLVYVDQRGTGSSGYLACPEPLPFQSTTGYLAACAGALAQGPIDLDHALTLDAARDLDLVRRALGYATISVRGGSYGTRVGLELIRQFPGSLTAVVLDGLFPPDDDYFSQAIAATDEGVALIIADCAADPACLAVSPQLGQDLTERQQELRQTPRPILVDGQLSEETAAVYVQVLGSLLGASRTRVQVPRAIHQARTGDQTLWNALLSRLLGATVTDAPAPAGPAGEPRALHQALRAPHFPLRGEGPREAIAPGVQLTVICAENFPSSPGVTGLEAWVNEQSFGDSSLVDFARACESWPVTPLSAELRQPVTSDVPVLLLNGAADINTFAGNGAWAAATLGQARNVIVPFATHSTLLTDCGAELTEAFILGGGDVAGLDTSCTERVPPPTW